MSETQILPASAPTQLSEERLRAFWSYVAARRRLELARRTGNPPWTTDPTLAQYRFTNVYRVSDRVSQYLLRSVLYTPTASPRPEEQVFRAVLFRMFNLPDTYLAFCRELDEAPNLTNWDPARYGTVLDRRMRSGVRVWNGAYMMQGERGEAKHHTYLKIIDQMVRDRLFDEIPHLPDKPARVFNLLRGYPRIADFLAMQFTTDIGYTSAVTWHEDQFVVAGHGAVRGARKALPYLVTGKPRPEYLIAYLWQSQEASLPDFPWLGGTRRLSLMDIQNCLCEFDKYTRVAHPEWEPAGGAKQPKQLFSHMGAVPLWEPMYPPKWGISGW